MKLRDYLKKLDENKVIAIGTVSGTCFMYIGEAGDTKLIDDIFSKYHKVRKSELGKQKKLIQRLIFSDWGSRSEDEYLSRAERISKAWLAYERNASYLDKYVPILDREVMEHYYKDVDNCEAVIVSGSEVGQFWFKSEFDKKYC